MTATETVENFGVAAVPTDDFNIFLHELRTRELRKMPGGARTFLSGGCSGAWYFEWIRQNYPGITRHIGVEAYSPEPDDLPPDVEWISNYLGDMSSVRSGEVDLVFAGQTVEHLWPEDLAAFLCEAHRVLAQDGWIVLDSPNRLVTLGLKPQWYHPQHTAELTVDEIVEMLTLAGFEDTRVRGVWLCYDHEGHKYLPFSPDIVVPGWSYQRRIAEASDRPENSFVWWVEARKGSRSPRREALVEQTTAVYDMAFAQRLTRSPHLVGQAQGCGRNRVVKTDEGQWGYMTQGPCVPLRAGHYEVTFAVGRLRQHGRRWGKRWLKRFLNTVVCDLEITSDSGSRVLAKRSLRFKDLSPGHMKEFTLSFVLKDTEFGIEFRALATNRAPLVCRVQQDIIKVNDFPN